MKLIDIRDAAGVPVAQADPYIIESGGRFYIYASGGQCYSADALLGPWVYEGICLEMPGQRMCWAPSVLERDGRFYMYYSSILDSDPDEHSQRLRLAVADDPRGPFVYRQDMLEPFSIDSHIVETPGGLFLFYSVNDLEAERIGTLIVCDRMQDLFTLEGRPEAIVRPTLDEEIYMRDRFRPGEDWHTIEGACYFYHEGFHYVLYSGANHTNPSYFIGYAVAEGAEDADLRQLDWVKQPAPDRYAPLVTRRDYVEGTGHNSVIYSAGKHWIVYHGRDIGMLEAHAQDTRTARIDVLEVERGRLAVEMTP